MRNDLTMIDVRLVVEPQEGAHYEDVYRVARMAEDASLNGLFFSDHLMAFGDGLREPGPVEPWTALAALARDTDSLRLGTLMTSATFRHPSMLAAQVAQVDQMSGGRVELGLGAGWWEAEHLAFGIDLPDIGKRFDRLEEQFEVLSRWWNAPTGGRVTWIGDHYSLVDCPALPRTLQTPLPLIVGGLGPRRTPDLAARFAHEFNAPYVLPEVVSRQFARVRDACLRMGRRPENLRYSAAVAVACGRTEKEFADRATAAGSSAESYRVRKAGGLPGEVAARLRQYVHVGCQRLYLQMPDLLDLDHLKLIVEEVLPLLSALSVENGSEGS